MTLKCMYLLFFREGVAVVKGGVGLDPRPTEGTAATGMGMMRIEKTKDLPGATSQAHCLWSLQGRTLEERTLHLQTTSVTARNSTAPLQMSSSATVLDKL